MYCLNWMSNWKWSHSGLLMFYRSSSDPCCLWTILCRFIAWTFRVKAFLFSSCSASIPPHHSWSEIWSLIAVGRNKLQQVAADGLRTKLIYRRTWRNEDVKLHQWNFLRLLCSHGLMLPVDRAGFSKTKKTELVSVCNPEWNLWTLPAIFPTCGHVVTGWAVFDPALSRPLLQHKSLINLFLWGSIHHYQVESVWSLCSLFESSDDVLLSQPLQV